MRRARGRQRDAPEPGEPHNEHISRSRETINLRAARGRRGGTRLVVVSPASVSFSLRRARSRAVRRRRTRPTEEPRKTTKKPLSLESNRHIRHMLTVHPRRCLTTPRGSREIIKRTAALQRPRVVAAKAARDAIITGHNGSANRNPPVVRCNLTKYRLTSVPQYLT